MRNIVEYRQSKAIKTSTKGGRNVGITELMTPEDVMGILKKGKRQVYDLFRSTLKNHGAFKLGGEWRITQEDLAKYLETLKAEQSAAAKVEQAAV